MSSDNKADSSQPQNIGLCNPYLLQQLNAAVQNRTYHTTWQRFQQTHHLATDETPKNESFSTYIVVADKVLTALRQAELEWSGFDMYARLGYVLPKNIYTMQFQLCGNGAYIATPNFAGCGHSTRCSQLHRLVDNLGDLPAYYASYLFSQGGTSSWLNAISITHAVLEVLGPSTSKDATKVDLMEDTPVTFHKILAQEESPINVEQFKSSSSEEQDWEWLQLFLEMDLSSGIRTTIECLTRDSQAVKDNYLIDTANEAEKQSFYTARKYLDENAALMKEFQQLIDQQEETLWKRHRSICFDNDGTKEGARKVHVTLSNYARVAGLMTVDLKSITRNFKVTLESIEDELKVDSAKQNRELTANHDDHLDNNQKCIEELEANLANIVSAKCAIRGSLERCKAQKTRDA